MKSFPGLLFCCVIFLMMSCTNTASETSISKDIQEHEAQVNQLLNNWHIDAANGNHDAYFDVMDEKSVFIGTDATENWTKENFSTFSKPYFDRGKAWDFQPIERHIYFSDNLKMAWFDELLNTWMGLCRGSGVVILDEHLGWKISHYVLSVSIPNDDIQPVIKTKWVFDSLFLMEKGFTPISRD